MIHSIIRLSTYKKRKRSSSKRYERRLSRLKQCRHNRYPLGVLWYQIEGDPTSKEGSQAARWVVDISNASHLYLLTQWSCPELIELFGVRRQAATQSTTNNQNTLDNWTSWMKTLKILPTLFTEMADALLANAIYMYTLVILISCADLATYVQWISHSSRSKLCNCETVEWTRIQEERV